jgi:hypothetical protein
MLEKVQGMEIKITDVPDSRYIPILEGNRMTELYEGTPNRSGLLVDWTKPNLLYPFRIY